MYRLYMKLYLKAIILIVLDMPSFKCKAHVFWRGTLRHYSMISCIYVYATGKLKAKLNMSLSIKNKHFKHILYFQILICYKLLSPKKVGHIYKFS